MEESVLTKIFRWEAEFNSWLVAEEFISLVIFLSVYLFYTDSINILGTDLTAKLHLTFLYYII